MNIIWGWRETKATQCYCMTLLTAMAAWPKRSLIATSVFSQRYRAAQTLVHGTYDSWPMVIKPKNQATCYTLAHIPFVTYTSVSSQADTYVVQLHIWIDRHGGGGPFGPATQALLAALGPRQGKEVLLDRWTQHTQVCGRRLPNARNRLPPRLACCSTWVFSVLCLSYMLGCSVDAVKSALTYTSLCTLCR